VGKDLKTASTELRAAGFEIRVSEEQTAQSRPNTVLRITPAAGTEVSETSPAVQLVVAAAVDAAITVPNVVGKLVGEAMTQLRDAGFAPQRRAATRNSSLAAMQVVAQDPAAGGRLARGGTVIIEFNPEPDVTPPAANNVTILYPDNRERQARDLAQQLFQGNGWQVTVKSGGASTRPGSVVYFVGSDLPTARGLAARATDWLKQQGQQSRSFRAVFEAATRGTNAANGGYFIIHTY
jgi:beta-lactam-binding protein with PASTA domain